MRGGELGWSLAVQLLCWHVRGQSSCPEPHGYTCGRVSGQLPDLGIEDPEDPAEEASSMVSHIL
jgi:hypothetical protein